MTDHRSPPPPAEACLSRPYPSSQKGGTVIAEQVLDLDTHERLLGNGGYRPRGCLRCGGPMHIHEYRERLLLGDPRKSTSVAIFQCADRERCGAVTRVLPALLARRLWRAWPTVEGAIAEAGDAQDGIRTDPVPPTTVRRWRVRLAASAAALVVVLGTASSTVPDLHQVVRQVGLDGTRAEFVEAFVTRAAPAASRGRQLATTAMVVHRLAPGVRLM